MSSCSVRGVLRRGLMIAVLVTADAAPAALVTVTASRDNTLFEAAAGTRSDGAGGFLRAGCEPDGARRRALVRFDLATSIPPGSRVRAALLTLQPPDGDTTAVVLAVHRLGRSWGEGASRAPGPDGAPAAPGDATWVHAFYDSVAWGEPGGDAAALPSATAALAGPGPAVWGSSPGLVADVQAWVDAPPANHGWMIRAADETGGATVRAFASRESAELERRPKLTVDFVPPVAVQARGWAEVKSVYRR
jgi:hypothetical protein